MTTHARTAQNTRRTLLALAPAIMLFGRRASATVNGAALVIGNGGYRSLPRLTNPGSDARAIGVMLEALGVQTEVLIDGEMRSLVEALERLRRRSAGKDLVIVFFAGHGIQRYDENWLVPVDAEINAAQDVRTRLLPLSFVLQVSNQSRQRVVILDACRDDPFSSSRTESGLARIADTIPGSLIAFATSPGRVALDGTQGHSPFTDALLDHLGTPGLDLRQVLTRVRQRVLLATEGRQVPWDTSSLTSDIVLRGANQRPVIRPIGAGEIQARQPRSSPQNPARPNNPLDPAPFDPIRYREIPATYATALRTGHILPQGLLVQKKNADGEDTPLCGTYSWGGDNSLLILLSYSDAQKAATFIISHTARVSRQSANWSQHDGEIDGTILRHIVHRTVRLRMDFSNGWANILHQIGRVGNLDTPFTTRFRRVD